MRLNVTPSRLDPKPNLLSGGTSASGVKGPVTSSTVVGGEDFRKIVSEVQHILASGAFADRVIEGFESCPTLQNVDSQSPLRRFKATNHNPFPRTVQEKLVRNRRNGGRPGKGRKALYRALRWRRLSVSRWRSRVGQLEPGHRNWTILWRPAWRLASHADSHPGEVGVVLP